MFSPNDMELANNLDRSRHFALFEGMRAYAASITTGHEAATVAVEATTGPSRQDVTPPTGQLPDAAPDLPGWAKYFSAEDAQTLHGIADRVGHEHVAALQRGEIKY